jgi:hypothetical protein
MVGEPLHCRNDRSRKDGIRKIPLSKVLSKILTTVSIFLFLYDLPRVDLFHNKLSSLRILKFGNTPERIMRHLSISHSVYRGATKLWCIHPNHRRSLHRHKAIKRLASLSGGSLPASRRGDRDALFRVAIRFPRSLER